MRKKMKEDYRKKRKRIHLNKKNINKKLTVKKSNMANAKSKSKSKQNNCAIEQKEPNVNDKGDKSWNKKGPNQRTNYERRFINRNGVEIMPRGEVQLFDLEVRHIYRSYS